MRNNDPRATKIQRMRIALKELQQFGIEAGFGDIQIVTDSWQAHWPTFRETCRGLLDLIETAENDSK